YTDENIQAIKDMAIGMGESLEYIETSLRYAFVGYATTEDAGIAQADYDDTVASILDPETTLSSLLTTYPGITGIIPNMSSYISKLADDEAIVANAVSACDTAMASSDSFTWAQISAIVDPIMETNSMLVGGMTIDEVKEYVMPGGTVDFGRALELLNGGGITITVPSGSGLLSDISDFAGDYTAKVVIENFSYGSIGPMNVNVNMQTATSVVPVYLNACNNGLKGATVSAAEGSNTITDYYGYAIDLAFRTNAENSNLLLQTDPAQRIYDDSESLLTQGGGSYMKFTTSAGLSATKMVKLMSGIRVVFMDSDQTVLAIAALDTSIGKESYVELSADDKTETGMFAYLNGSNSDYQYSDLIDYSTYEALPEESSVIFDTENGEIFAKLYLYQYSMTLNSNNDKTGGLTIGLKQSDSVITPLRQDIPERVTALVYLDGSVVNNSMVAADAIQSMTGVLNLQFASDAVLIPAENSALRNISNGSEEEPEPADPGQGGDDPGQGG
ncbi:MAG: hypothetical protein IJT91_05940, partial [Clostridia bacterium]|nr:hypothetical protein [Clostridia bacterium]